MSTPHCPLPAAPDPALPVFPRLHPMGRVGVNGAACASGNKGALNCQRCVEACPWQALARPQASLELDPFRCSGCGLCAVECPVAALAVEGHHLAPAPQGAPLLIACEPAAGRLTVPAELRRVPCIAGIAVNDLLQWALGPDTRTVRVLDQNLCGECPSLKGDALRAWDALEQARRWLAAVGVPAEQLPQRVSAAMLPEGNASAAEPAPAAGRRAFMAGLSRALVGSVAGSAPGTAAPGGLRQRRPGISPGEQTRELLRQLAQRPGHHLPAEARLPAVEAREGCEAHGACAAACPSGALRLDQTGTDATLRFDPWRCIGCGGCEEICPTHSLHYRQPAWSPFIDFPVALATVATRACRRCGAPFVQASDRDLCDRCGKARNLAAAGSALFHPSPEEARRPP